MKRSQVLQLITTTMAAGLLFSSCGGRAPGVGIGGADAPTTTAPVADSPSYSDPGYTEPSYPDSGYGDPYQPPTTTQPIVTQPTGQPNAKIGEYKVDDEVLNDWQARGIAVSGGSVYIAAVDKSGVSRKGTVLKMNASTGKIEKNLGSSLLGLRYKLDSTLMSVAVSGGNLYAVDSSKGLFSITTSNGEIKELKGSGAVDIAGNNNGLFLAANGQLERSSMTGTSRAPMNGLTTTAGVGADSRGNAYFVNSSRIGMVDATTGQARDVVMQGLVGPIDVSGDGRTGDVYVLEQSEVKRFSATGQLIAQFAHGAVKAFGIAVDEAGNVYVSDFGENSKGSKIVKFGPSTDGMAGVPQQQVGSYGQVNSYGAYTAPQTGTYAQGAYAAPAAYQQPAAYSSYAAPQQQVPVYQQPVANNNTRRY